VIVEAAVAASLLSCYSPRDIGYATMKQNASEYVY